MHLTIAIAGERGEKKTESLKINKYMHLTIAIAGERGQKTTESLKKKIHAFDDIDRWREGREEDREPENK